MAALGWLLNLGFAGSAASSVTTIKAGEVEGSIAQSFTVFMPILVSETVEYRIANDHSVVTPVEGVINA